MSERERKRVSTGERGSKASSAEQEIRRAVSPNEQMDKRVAHVAGTYAHTYILGRFNPLYLATSTHKDISTSIAISFS